MCVSEQLGVLTKQTSARHPPPPGMRHPERGWCGDSTTPSLHLNHVGNRCRHLSPNASPAGGPGRARAALPGRKIHRRLPWLERMGWGREAEVGATVGGELLGLTHGAADSLESSLT